MIKIKGRSNGSPNRSFHATVWGEFILTIILVVFLFPGSQYLYANPDSFPPQVVAGVSHIPDKTPPIVDTFVPEMEKPGHSDTPIKNADPNQSDSTEQSDSSLSGEDSPQPVPEPGEAPVVVPDHPVPSLQPVFRGNPQAGKKVALTFDDGPYALWTAEYLKVLEECQVPATFFLVGTRVEKYPEIAQKITDHGFELGSHSYRHAKLTLVKEEILEEDFHKTAAAFSVVGKVKFFRPPYGAHNQLVTDTAEKFGLKTIGWNVDPRDWETEDAHKISQRVLSHVTNGSIIILHEGRQSTLAALPQIIAGLQDQGYQIVTVSELLN